MTITLEDIHAELVAIRKALAGKSNRPHLITVRVLDRQLGWDRTKTTDTVIDANRITKIEPFQFWAGVGQETFLGCFVHLGRDEGYHLAQTVGEVRAMADAP